MTTIKLDSDKLQFVRELIGEIDSQDNRCTAVPYFYVIRTQETIAVPDGCGDEIRYLHCDGEMMTEAEVREWAEEPDKDIDDIIDDSDGCLTKYDIMKRMVTPENHNVFFTEKACRKHIESNHYHFTLPQDYVRHAWRNPEMDQIFEVLRQIAEPENEVEG